MGKESRARVLADHQAMAVARNIRVSPRKLNLVAQQIRGKKVDRALNVLTFSQKRIAGVVKKALQSAIANAENNHDLDVDDLVVKEASVGKNLVMKRFHARARGNAGGIEKFFSQITIVVEEKREEAPRKKPRPPPPRARRSHRARRPAKKPAAKKPAPRPRRKLPNGSESQSDRAAPRHQPYLGLALVCGQEGIRQAAAGRHQDPRISQRQAEGRRRVAASSSSVRTRSAASPSTRPVRAW